MSSDTTDQFRLGTINTDGSNRHVSINKSSSLGEDLIDRFANMDVDVISLTEFSPLAALNRLHEVSSDKDYDFVYTGSAANKIVEVWDREKFSFDINGAYDASKNYIGVPLTLRNTEEKVLQIGVHLPNKSGRTQAMTNLKKYIWESKASGKYNSIHLHGDFNLSTAEVMMCMPDMCNGIPIDVTTTTGGRCIDNILVPRTDGIHSGKVHTESHHFNHHPISATVCLGDTAKESEVSDATDLVPCVLIKKAYVKVCKDDGMSVWYLNPSMKKTKLPACRKVIMPSSDVQETS